jgi:hypothetical protein
MTFDEAIKQYIVSREEFTNLAGDKIFPDILPKSIKLPGITYQIISSFEDWVMSGNDCWVESIYQFSVTANSKVEAVTLINIIKKIFRNLKSNDFFGYKLQGTKTLDRLQSSFEENVYVEIQEIKFFHDYIE